jgi:transcriptional regulator with XRE-family HTH domain
VRARRRALGVSQLALALEAGISSRHLSCIESGRSQPGRDVVYRLIRGLAVGPCAAAELARLAGFVPPAECKQTPRAGETVVVTPIDALFAASVHASCIVDGDGVVLASNDAFDAALGLVAPAPILWSRVCGTGPRDLRRLTIDPFGLSSVLMNRDAVLAAWDARARGSEASDVVEHYRIRGIDVHLRPLVARFSDDARAPRLESFVPASSQDAERLAALIAERTSPG